MNYNASDIVLLGVKFENASLKLERDLFTTQHEVSFENIILEKEEFTAFTRTSNGFVRFVARIISKGYLFLRK